MHGMFSRLSKPLSEDDKLEIILHNIRPCYASALTASSEIKDLKSLKSVCSNYENIHSRMSLFHEPPRVTSETVAPEFAYTKQQNTSNYYPNKSYQGANYNEKSYTTPNKYNNYTNTYNYNNKPKITQETPTSTNALQVTPSSSKYVHTTRKYCPRCRSDTHSLKECKQPQFDICFKCGNKGIRYPDCTTCNPKPTHSKN